MRLIPVQFTVRVYAHIAVLFLVPCATTLVGASPQAVIAWQDVVSGSGMIRVARAEPPWDFLTPALAVNRFPVIRVAGGLVYVVSRDDGTIQVVDPTAWSILRAYNFGPMSQPVDIAVVDGQRAFVTRHLATRLLRLDLMSGETAEAVDLSPFADGDGIPEMGGMAVRSGRLFIAMRREAQGGGFPSLPGQIAVMNLLTEQLIDADPSQPGVQPIELEGFGPKRKMRPVAGVERFVVTAASGDLQHGGVELVDPVDLRSAGLIVRAADGTTGLEIHTATMVTSDVGFLTFTTDLTLSSHVVRFTIGGGVDPPPSMYDIAGYEMPALEWNPFNHTLLVPVSQPNGVHVFNAATKAQLTVQPIPTMGPPTDIVMLCTCTDAICPGDWTCEKGISMAVPTLSFWGMLVLGFGIMAAATWMVRPFRSRLD